MPGRKLQRDPATHQNWLDQVFALGVTMRWKGALIHGAQGSLTLAIVEALGPTAEEPSGFTAGPIANAFETSPSAKRMSVPSRVSLLCPIPPASCASTDGPFYGLST